jgi:hypothetical protein
MGALLPMCACWITPHVNHMLVADGWCWWYRKYTPEDAVVEELGKSAREERKGLGLNHTPCRCGSGGRVTQTRAEVHRGHRAGSQRSVTAQADRYNFHCRADHPAYTAVGLPPASQGGQKPLQTPAP